MICNKCSKTYHLEVGLCPFCSEPHDMLQAIYKQRGDAVLGTSQFVNLMLDCMPNAEVRFKNIFRQAVKNKVDLKLRQYSKESGSGDIKIISLFHSFKNTNSYNDYADYVLNCFLFAFGYLSAAPSPTAVPSPGLATTNRPPAPPSNSADLYKPNAHKLWFDRHSRAKLQDVADRGTNLDGGESKLSCRRCLLV